MDIKQKALDYFKQLGFEPKQSVSLGTFSEVVSDGQNSLQLDQSGGIVFANQDFSVHATFGGREKDNFEGIKRDVEEWRKRKEEEQ